MGVLGSSGEQPWNLERVQELHWRELEQKIGAALEEKGYEVRVTPPQKDGGRDVDADKIALLKSILFRPKLRPRRERLVIDAKQWNSPVGANPVEKIADVAEEHEATGVIASPSGFYQAARDVAEWNGVKLYDGERIVNLFNNAGVNLEEVD